MHGTPNGGARVVAEILTAQVERVELREQVVVGQDSSDGHSSIGTKLVAANVEVFHAR